MEPMVFFTLIAMGAAIGCVLGFVITGEGYGWAFNGVAGIVGAVGGSQIIANSHLDMGLYTNALVAAALASLATSLVLRT